MSLISVVMPAFNAGTTIDETLHSVRGQSWRDLEILVVDDGSSDDTSERVGVHARADERVRLIRVANGGVAHARNIGAREARGDFIAPVDADDLWHPHKLSLQMQALRAAPRPVGLVYCWSVIIDELGHIIRFGHPHMDAGNVLRPMCRGNLVGNGSVPLMVRSAMEAAGRYDPGLRAQRAQGCEDLKLYFAIAERYEFAVVPQYLVGYRETAASMSSDGRQMLRSFDLVMDPARDRHPQYGREFHEGRTYLANWLLDRALRYGSSGQVRAMFIELFRQAPFAALRALPRSMKLLRGRLAGGSPGRRFADIADAEFGVVLSLPDARRAQFR